MWWRINRAINRFNKGLTLETRHHYIVQTQGSKKKLMYFAIRAFLLYRYLISKAHKNRVIRKDFFQSHLSRCWQCGWCFENETTKIKNKELQSVLFPTFRNSLSQCFRYPDHLCLRLFPFPLWANRNKKEKFLLHIFYVFVCPSIASYLGWNFPSGPTTQSISYSISVLYVTLLWLMM